MGVIKKQNRLVKQEKINSGHYIELLDRTHVVCMIIDTHLVKHPLATADKEIKFQLEQALDKLYDAYQLIGSKINDDEGK